MIRALAIACATVVALGGVAAAEATYIRPPAGWSREDDQARSLAAKANSVKHFGGATSLATTLVYVAPAGYAAGLYITAVAGEVTEHREAAARVEVDSFLAAPTRAQLSSPAGAPTIVVDETASAVDPAAKAIDATVKWRDTSSGLSAAARLIVVADATHLYAVSAECSHGEMPGAHVDACLAALATLDPGVPLASRVPLALAPQGAEPPPPPEPAPSGHGGPPPPTMSDGTRAPLPPMVVPGATKRTTDRRPVYVGLGIVVLAAVFWWNRRRRERLEKESNDDDR